MSQKRKQRAAAPRDLSFGAVQRKLAEEGAAAAAPSPRAKKKTAALQIEKLIDKWRNPKNQSRWEVRALSPRPLPPSHLRHAQYLVRWRGFDQTKDSWEPFNNVCLRSAPLPFPKIRRDFSCSLCHPVVELRIWRI